MPQLTRRTVLAAALTSCETTDAAQGRAVQSHPLHGVWDLVSLEDFEADGKVIYWLGRGASGTIAYTPGGRMFVQFLGDPHPVFAAGNVFSPDGRRLLPTATEEEVRTAFGGYYAYFGRYDIDEERRVVTHHVQSSLRPHEIGANYERPYELSGDRLVLRYSVRTEDGRTNTRVITRRRAEPLRG
jgi:hypothetical protein